MGWGKLGSRDGFDATTDISGKNDAVILSYDQK